MARTHAQKALLKRTLKKVEQVAAKPGRLRWDQKAYRQVKECGTFMCFAGWGCQLAGGKWRDVYSLLATRHDAKKDRNLDGTVSPYWRARQLFGLDEREAMRLFSWRNSLDDLRVVVRELTR